ncbi:PREDICTED: histone acetyltransferase HAC12-like [Fragaria vesca subsp. vesca]|uniref:histone acetyltransferase HAC12-like n=1 Tax=Fragaria vesca subsp. vesca TaxID=101020 RepID=UPI0002C2E5AD|nr:PREDICTED: histone acetyltransferase HAC12-like [Fragaria vesca subsp. vesca]
MDVMMNNSTSSPLIFGGRIPGYPTLSSISSLVEDFVKGLSFNNKQTDVNVDLIMEAPQVSTFEPPPVTKTYHRNRNRNRKRSPAVTHGDSDESSEDSQPCSKRLRVDQTKEGASDSEVMQVKMGEVESSIQDEPKPECVSEVTKRDEQIKAHLQSLVSTTTPMSCSNNDRVCQFCASGELLYAATPMYCSNCGCRIKERGNYYSTPTEHGAKYCFCSRCYNNTRSGDILLGDHVKVPKASLEKKKNDEEIEEPWVRCGRCEGWQHQICALYNDKCDSEEYVCFKCVLREMELGEHKPKNVGFCAKDLPTTMLSDHIEKRLIRRLEQERKERMSKEKGNESSEVVGVEGLVVREVLSVEKTVKVKQQYLDLFPEQSYPAEFPYKSKVILMFQKIDGVDVCIFGMYVQEFGSECSYHPNKGCVYISYLDSVKYFRPAEGRTATGEALRTFVYHEVLIGYLDFCKKQGFVTAYIWACPPAKEEDYILYCHPPMQKTPLPIKLRKWYQSMIKKASNEGIVVGTTNLYDRYFVPSSTGECHSKVTAARLPHFDGDYWSTAAQDLIKEIGKEEETKIRKRTLEAMGHTNDSYGSTKDILLMQKLGDAILTNRENFMVVDLQYVCIRCNKAILSGENWSCSHCKNLHLCEKCHSLCGGKDIHMTVDMEQHVLSRVTVLQDYELPDTKEGEIILNNGLFEERTSFLNFCVKNHYQFDTLRQAKYSSLMILHHLSDFTALTSAENNETCSSSSHKNADQSLVCEINEDKGSSPMVGHVTKISRQTKLTEGLSAELMKELLQVLKHAALCFPTKNRPCSYPNRNCITIKKLFVHVKKCSVRASGGCQPCNKAWVGLIFHSRICTESNCVVPRCMDLRNYTDQRGKTRDGTKTVKANTKVSSCSSQTSLPTKAQWLPEVGIWASPYIIPF